MLLRLQLRGFLKIAVAVVRDKYRFRYCADHYPEMDRRPQVTAAHCAGRGYPLGGYQADISRRELGKHSECGDEVWREPKQ